MASKFARQHRSRSDLGKIVRQFLISRLIDQEFLLKREKTEISLRQGLND